MPDNECYEILLNYTCNLNCLFCSQGDFNKLISRSYDDIAKEIYRAKKLGYKKLGLSGGEPTIRKDIIKIVRFAKKTGFNFIRIQTNGILLSDYNFARELKEAGVSFCKFSLTSHIPEIHNKLTKNPNSYKNVIKAIENMKKLKIRVGNNILINKYNYNQLPQFIEFLLEKGVSNFVIIYPLYTGNMYKNHKELAIDIPSCRKYFLKAIKIMEENNMLNDLLFLNLPPCFLPEYKENIIGLNRFNTTVSSPDGEFNLDENADSNKVKTGLCKRCSINNQCKGVDKGYIDIFGWKGFKPVKELKKKKVYLNDDERCLIEILQKGRKMTMDEIIKISRKIPLCSNCQDANNIINAATSLSFKKLINIEFSRGKYYFSLI